MADLDADLREPDPAEASAPMADDPGSGRPRGRDYVVPVLLTSVAVVAAAVVGWFAWNTYMAAPWTRDGRVRAYLVVLAPDVAGRITEMPIHDNQFVHKGDLVMTIDPTTYATAVASAEAQVEQSRAEMGNRQAVAQRRQALTTLSTSVEERQTAESAAASAVAAYHQAVADLARAKVDLERTRIVSPVNGWVTNLLWQLGDYASVGEKKVSVVNADSFWIDAYFEETSLRRIHEDDPATIKLMGFDQVLRGHVETISHGITVDNAQPGSGGLATVNPVFTWVRLAQRLPVRIHIDQVPPGIILAAGLTATVQVDSSRKDKIR